MKIILKNFRCHQDSTFQIPDKGLVMLSGDTGVGKSTIFNAISYAMYGNLRKPYSHGSTTCQVTLEFEGMVITRSNRPNRVVVTYQDVEYEDDAAQGLIEKIIGMNYQEFMASSYVVQSLHNSVVSMTPTEQVKFVEALAFSDNIHIEYREKFREAVRDAKEELTKCEGRVSVAEKQVEMARNEILPSSPPDIEKIDPNAIKEERVVVTQRLKDARGKVATLQKEIEEFQESEKRNKDFQEQKRILEIEISQFNQLRTNLGIVPDDSMIEKFETELAAFKALQIQTQKYHAHVNVLKKIEKYQSEHTEMLQAQINELHDSIPSREEVEKLESRVNLLEETRKAYELESADIASSKKTRNEATAKIKEIFADSKKLFPGKQISRIKKSHTLLAFLESKIKVLKSEFEAMKKNISELEAKASKQEILGKVYTCPYCSMKVAFKDEELIPALESECQNNEDYNILLISERLNFANSQTRFNKVEELTNSLKAALDVLCISVPQATISYEYHDAVDMEKKLENYHQIQKNIAILQSQLDGSSKPSENSAVKDLRTEAKLLAKGYPKDFDPKKSIEEIERGISKITSDLDNAWRTKSEYSSLSREINTREGKLQRIIKSFPGNKKLLPSRKTRTLSSATQEMDIVRDQILADSGRIEELTGIMEHIAKYEEYQKKLNTIKTFEKQLAEYEEKRLHSEGVLSGAMGLEIAGKEAEILAMEKTIESINEHAKHYLDELFEEPISVRLEGIKTTSKGVLRTQMNTVVLYKGEESSIDDLSGGETQRVELAFILAVNDMIGSRVILLDECLNNLNAEVNMDVLSQLQSFSEGKLILVISHEAVQGVFDEIVSLEK